MKERAERSYEPENQEAFSKIVSSNYDRKATRIKSQQWQ